MPRFIGVLATAVLSLVLVTGQVPAAEAEAGQPASRGDRSHSCRSGHQTVTLTADGRGLRLSTTRVRAGRVTFRASTTNAGSEVTLFRPRRGVAPARVVADVMSGLVSDDRAVQARAARAMKRDARFYGVTQIQPGTPATATLVLKPGRYYAAEFMFGRPAPTPITFTVVRGRDDDDDDHEDDDDDQARHRRNCAPADAPTIVMQRQNRISLRGELLASGSVVVRNRSRAVQIAVLSPITPGTTEAQVQAYFDGGAEGPWPFPAEGPSVGAGYLSPGRDLVLSYAVTPGTYLLASYMPDLRTGLPTAFMGMHRVVILR